jgi:ATP/maltotriose-dependent transcriptional regulator MalT
MDAGRRVMNSQHPAASPATNHRGIALLDRASRPLRDAALATGRPGRALEPLEGGNPLGIPLDRRREWYHYHHLFSASGAQVLGRTEL